MLIELHDENWKEFDGILDKVRLLTDWSIDDVFMQTLSSLTPLRYDKEVIAVFDVKYGSNTYHRILSVNNTIQLEWSGNSRGTPISVRDVGSILPYADEIINAVVTRKDEVRILFHLRKNFMDMPEYVDTSNFIDINGLNFIGTGDDGQPECSEVKGMSISTTDPQNINITIGKEGDTSPSTTSIYLRSNMSVSSDWMFKASNLPALVEVYKKFIDWYSKTFEKQMKIRDAMLKIKKTMEVEKRLLQ